GKCHLRRAADSVRGLHAARDSRLARDGAPPAHNPGAGRVTPMVVETGRSGVIAGLDTASRVYPICGASYCATRASPSCGANPSIFVKTFCEGDGCAGHKRVHARLPTRYARA